VKERAIESRQTELDMPEVTLQSVQTLKTVTQMPVNTLGQKSER